MMSEERLHMPKNQKERQELADGISHLKNMLLNEKLITDKVSAKISTKSVLIGKRIHQHIMKMFEKDTKISEDNEFLNIDKIKVEVKKENLDDNIYDDMTSDINKLLEINYIKVEPKEEDIDSSSDKSYEPEEEEENEETEKEEEEEVKERIVHDHVPYAVKLRAVELSELHPTWSISTLRTKSLHRLKSEAQLVRWKQQIKKDKTTPKKHKVEENVYKRFVRVNAKKEIPITNSMLKKWAIDEAAKLKDKNFKFNASNHWVIKFKKTHNILTEYPRKS